MMLLVATWNVNSIRKRLDHVCDWLVKEKVDIALLQEIRCTSEQFPYRELEALGYHCIVCGQKARNGVAIVSKYPVENIVMKLPEAPLLSSISLFPELSNNEARYLECSVKLSEQQKIIVASVYVPNGQEVNSESFKYKLEFFDCLYSHLKSLLLLEEVVIVGGDYNVAPEDIDVFSPEDMKDQVCFHIKERAKLRSIFNSGYIDAFRALNGVQQQFSWWHYRGAGWQKNCGMRIDHMLLSPQAADLLQKCIVNTAPRALPEPSDHAPVQCYFDK